MRVVLIVFVVVCSLVSALPVYAQAASSTSDYLPTRYGVALLAGTAYSPDHFGLLMAQGQVQFDYDRIFWHAAPELLRLKLEANAGITTDGRQRGLLAVNAMALYYLERFKRGSWTPYGEAGIGLVYSDFQVAGQGRRFNFNPQAGVGLEYALPSGAALTTAVRLHHISNANTHEDNRGVNSALLMIGYLF